jgi:hypothetical protein
MKKLSVGLWRFYTDTTITILDIIQSQSQSQSYFAIDSLWVSTSWCWAHSGTYDQMLFSFRSFMSCLFLGALSDERSGLSFVSLSLRPVFYLKLNSIHFSVPYKKHSTSPLRAQQVNAIYRFVTMVY